MNEYLKDKTLDGLKSDFWDYVQDRLETVKGYGDYALYEAEIVLLERILNREKQL